MQHLLKKLFQQYYKDVYTYLFSLCHDADLSEDLTSEVFLEVVRSLAGFRRESDVKTWLFTIARHRWYHWLRRQHHTVKTVAMDELLDCADTREKIPENLLCSQELARRVRSFLEEQTPRNRQVMTMRLEGYSFYEIAGAVGVSESSARVLYFRTKKKLQELLKKEGFVHG